VALQEGRLWGALSSISEGDVMSARGRKDGDGSTLLASHVVLRGRRDKREVSGR
jgi:hypothetical protein